MNRRPRLGDFFQCVRIFEIELRHRGSAQRLQMRAAAQFPSHFVRNGTHVGSRGDAGAKIDAIVLDAENDELFDLNSAPA